jgi:hypothetical protein
LTHSGYHLREILCSPVGTEALRWSLATGFRLRRDYSTYYEAHDRSTLSEEKRTWLVGLTKEEAITDYGSRASGLFVFTLPRFGFTQGEQDLLEHAIRTICPAQLES